MRAEPTWVVVLPVKRLDAAKTRLRGALPGVRHDELALALARDTIDAVVRCPSVAEVMVVTDDQTAARLSDLFYGMDDAGIGLRVVADVGDGLNAAFASGAGLVAGAPVAGLTADLPALRPTELAGALAAAAAHAGRAYLTDSPGTGTTLLTAPAGTALDPRFGPGSALAHAASGAAALPGAWPTVRRDVDTPADLAEAVELGLGRHTAALLRVTVR